MVQAAEPNGVRSAGRYWAIYGPTIFLSASLLFFVQPLFAKMVLPVLGGAPAVWTTAMLFFQTALILGYGYAHLLSRYVNVPGQMMIHAALWILAAFSLPLAIDTGWQFDPEAPIAAQTLLVFAAGVGLPFVALAANAPLIQHWYAQLDTSDADNPYVLYGASNLGSLLSLLAFPLVAEPLFGATAISVGWSVLFGLLGLALMATAATAAGVDGWRPALLARAAAAAVPAPRLGQVGYWLFLAFLPSSLMLAITTKIATDFGSVPLIWVVPLALYLLTFVLVFTRQPLLSQRVLWFMAAASTALLLGIYAGGIIVTLPLAIAVIAAFFALALFAHDKLYRARPDAAHLTLFYLIMSFGGALGGLFNSIIAPVAFNDVYEGPVTLSLYALLLGFGAVTARGATIGIIAAAAMAGSVIFWLPAVLSDTGTIFAAFIVTSFVLVAATAKYNIALPVFVVLALAITITTRGSAERFADRSFFGTHTIFERDDIRFYANGSTLHGSQRLTDIDAARPEPLSYYHAKAPLGQLMDGPIGQAAETVGIVGLGVGALACHATPTQSWHYYEIDPLVDVVARDADQFTYLSACTPNAPTYLGDARIVLEGQDGLTFDVLVIDAYSSDVVPVHLTTVEAMGVYLDRLNPDGLLAMHISNRYFSLELPIARIAEELGLEMRLQRYTATDDPEVGDQSSIVAILARDEGALGALAEDERWSFVDANGFPLWTDDHANPLSALNVLQ
ncbi:MAG: transporter [Pseudomonadota bacterium]